MALSFTLLVMFIFLCQTEKPGSKRDYDGVPWLDQEVYGKSQDTWIELNSLPFSVPFKLLQEVIIKHIVCMQPVSIN